MEFTIGFIPYFYFNILSNTIFTRGIKEYQQLDQHIALTLLATTGELGKPDLAYRPGRASGDTTKKGHVLIPTEDA